MPEFELGSDSFLNWLTVQAAMLFPEDAPLRSSYVAAKYILPDIISVECPKTLTLPRELVSVLLFSPSYDEIERKAKENGLHGRLVGKVLLALCQMHHYKINEPSFRKAFDVVAETITGTTNERSPKTLGNYWEAYASVAHLWAALLICEIQGIEDNIFAEEAGIAIFFGVAEYLRKVGETLTTLRDKAKKTALDPLKTWKVPEPGYEIQPTGDTEAPHRIAWFAYPCAVKLKETPPGWLTSFLENYQLREVKSKL